MNVVHSTSLNLPTPLLFSAHRYTWSRLQAQYVLNQDSSNPVILTSYPQQPTGGDASVASLVEVGVWAIIAKVLLHD